MKIRRVREIHKFGVVYVVVSGVNPIRETAEVVEVHESEGRAYESRDKHERNGVRDIVVVERRIER